MKKEAIAFSEDAFNNALASAQLAPFPLQSRVHPLRGLAVHVKRDDELSFGVSGSKLRKYASLVPRLGAAGIDEAVLIGGAHSNNVLGLSQRLIENGILPWLFLRGERPQEVVGNHLLIRLIVPDQQIVWISRSDWPHVTEIARSFAAARIGKRVFVVDEGASVPEAIPGALSLALDILRNERETKVRFEHVVMDAGTGMMAAVTAAAFAHLGRRLSVDIVLLSGNEASFAAVQTKVNRECAAFFGRSPPLAPCYRLRRPKRDASFGSVGRETLAFVGDFARRQGILTDPVYSAKLFAEALAWQNDGAFNGPVLIVHSGGGTGLWGYASPLAKLLQ